ncbi:hypothetical protein LSS_09993 [Leptospira santarosai serovar Shermani str. LT 821]|uniref:Uncharacterized protein n=1 Tax=Leptospira santarosai serovar Shermani str. LT 821 TaxID=758847 RepID=K8Y1R0_9LEPT|nr:hypothetical protein LSS_09993 [Leptospira santarosai serovar Shermani str. LT 821]
MTKFDFKPLRTRKRFRSDFKERVAIERLFYERMFVTIGRKAPVF